MAKEKRKGNEPLPYASQNENHWVDIVRQNYKLGDMLRETSPASGETQKSKKPHQSSPPPIREYGKVKKEEC